MLFLKPPFQNKLHLKISTFLLIKVFKFQTVQNFEFFFIQLTQSELYRMIFNQMENKKA